MWRPWTEQSVEATDNEVQVEVVEELPQTPKAKIIKHTRQHPLSKDAQRVIRNVHTSFENSEGGSLKKTAQVTGVCTKTVSKIVKRGVITPKRKGNKKRIFSRIDSFTCDLVRRMVYGMYKEKVVPTLDALRLKLENATDGDFPYKKTMLRALLIKLGFRFKTLQKRRVIMESQRIVLLRYTYLSKIKKARREGKTIVWLDETWYDTHDVVRKGWDDLTCGCALDVPVARGKRIIILHAGSDNGWISNGLLLSAKNIADSAADYHSDMNSALFEKWFSEQLIPNLPNEGCVIVMDNASYHSHLLKKNPNSSTRKNDIINFMISENIPLPDPIPIKPVLIGIVKQYNIQKTYVIDTLAHDAGHTVLCLPPYYCVFNPIELIWSQLKRGIRQRNVSPELSTSVVKLIREEEERITADNWRNCVSHVIKEEDKYILQDEQRDQDETSFIINLGDDRSESESDYDN